MSKFVVVFLFAVLSCYTVYSQNKLVIDDRISLLTEEVEELLKAKLAENDIEYTTMVDFKARCEYYFAELKLFLPRENILTRQKQVENLQLRNLIPPKMGALKQATIIHAISLPLLHTI